MDLNTFYQIGERGAKKYKAQTEAVKQGFAQNLATDPVRNPRDFNQHDPIFAMTPSERSARLGMTDIGSADAAYLMTPAEERARKAASSLAEFNDLTPAIPLTDYQIATSEEAMGQGDRDKVEKVAATSPSLADIPLNDLVRATVRGDYGNGENRKKLLGSRYKEVQDAINADPVAYGLPDRGMNLNWASIFNSLLPLVALGGLGYLGYRKLR